MTREARRLSNVCAAVLALFANTACGGDDDGTNTKANRKTKGDTASRDAGPEPTETIVKSYRVAIEVPDVPPGTEGTKCVKVRLGNADPVHIGRVHNQLFGQSHHFIVS